MKANWSGSGSYQSKKKKIIDGENEFLSRGRNSERVVRHPWTRWTDDLCKVAGRNWMTEGRAQWYAVGEVYLQQWTKTGWWRWWWWMSVLICLQSTSLIWEAVSSILKAVGSVSDLPPEVTLASLSKCYRLDQNIFEKTNIVRIS